MSNEQLVTAYLNGDLGRRQLVRRLVAGGVTLTAALAYAGVVPAAAQADSGHKHRGATNACYTPAWAALASHPDGTGC